MLVFHSLKTFHYILCSPRSKTKLDFPTFVILVYETVPSKYSFNGKMNSPYYSKTATQGQALGRHGTSLKGEGRSERRKGKKLGWKTGERTEERDLDSIKKGGIPRAVLCR